MQLVEPEETTDNFSFRRFMCINRGSSKVGENKNHGIKGEIDNIQNTNIDSCYLSK